MRSKERKESILVEAARLFKEKGFAATSMRDLAGAVGIEAASLYNHIRSKQEVLREICFDIANQYMSSLEEAEGSHSDTLSKLKQLIALHIQINTKQRDRASVAYHEWRHLEEPFLSRYLNLRHHYEDRLLHIIQVGIGQNQVRPVDPRIALYTLLSSVTWIQNWYNQDRKINSKSLGNQLTTLILEGLKMESR